MGREGRLNADLRMNLLSFTLRPHRTLLSVHVLPLLLSTLINVGGVFLLTPHFTSLHLNLCFICLACVWVCVYYVFIPLRDIKCFYEYKKMWHHKESVSF